MFQVIVLSIFPEAKKDFRRRVVCFWHSFSNTIQIYTSTF